MKAIILDDEGNNITDNLETDTITMTLDMYDFYVTVELMKARYQDGRYSGAVELRDQLREKLDDIMRGKP